MRMCLIPAEGGKVPATKAEKRAADLYREHYPEMAFNFALLGLNDFDIARLMHVSIETMEMWCQFYPEFSSQLYSGRTQADATVAAAVYKNAIGFERKTTKFVKTRNADGSHTMVPEEVLEQVPPNQAAAEFWLTNRQPDLWKKTQVIEQRGVQFVIHLNDADSRV